MMCTKNIFRGKFKKLFTRPHNLPLLSRQTSSEKTFLPHLYNWQLFFNKSFLWCICCKSWNSIHNPLCYQTLFQFYPQGKSRNGLYWIQVYFGSIHWTISSMYKIYSISTPIYFDKIFNNDTNQKLNLCQSLSCVRFCVSSQCLCTRWLSAPQVL